MANTQKRRIGLLSALVLCASFVGLAAPTGAQAQQEPEIHFINPSDFSEGASDIMPILSKRRTGSADAPDQPPTENTYRLSAWTKNAPAGAIVEFEVVVGINTVNIGTAEQVAPDAYQFHWALTDVPVDGNYTIRAILFDGVGLGAEEIARDEMDVLIQRDMPTDAPAADLVYPASGGDAGFYTNPKTGASNIAVQYNFSEGTDFVGVYYTVSPVGEEPAWKLCETTRPAGFFGNPGSPGFNRATCDLESIDQGGQNVTGIAVVANEETAFQVYDENNNKAGDAVRLFPYEQFAGNVTVVENPTQRVEFTPDDPDQPGDQSGFPCSEDISAVVTDQFGSPISGMSVDVHAQGPSDQLKFAVGGPLFFSGSGSPPDDNHPGIEPQFDCTEQEEIVPNQGDHTLAGIPDVKHVEANSGTGGTRTVFMHSDRAGATQVTFWADEDEDDRPCTEEPAAAASIGWGEDPPAPVVETPSEQICPIPDPPDPNEVPECSDGVDNDGDGETDHPEDDGCDSAEDDDETDPEEDPRACTIEGTGESETITGTEEADIICGNGGDDIIDGLGGDDIIFGDGGGDTIRGGDGDDTIHGGDDRDTLRGQSGNDAVNGNRDNDTLVGGGGADDLNGNIGVDTLRGGGGGDILKGGVGRDVLTGGAGGDTLQGGRGIDTIKGRRGPDILRGGRHNDNLRGGRGNDSLNGGPGIDTCRGQAGRDRTFNCER